MHISLSLSLSLPLSQPDFRTAQPSPLTSHIVLPKGFRILITRTLSRQVCKRFAPLTLRPEPPKASSYPGLGSRWAAVNIRSGRAISRMDIGFYVWMVSWAPLTSLYGIHVDKQLRWRQGTWTCQPDGLQLACKKEVRLMIQTRHHPTCTLPPTPRVWVYKIMQDSCRRQYQPWRSVESRTCSQASETV